MLNQIKNNSCIKNYSFVHEGDLDAITPEMLSCNFGGELNKISSVVSCAYKHILAYKALVQSAENIALILEDDIYLDSNFCKMISNIVSEIENRQLVNFLISLEDSNLKYIKNSQLQVGTFLYKRLKGRMAGAYIIDKQCAQHMLQEIDRNKCNLPIDWFHNYCSENKLIDIYWSHPAIAIQGSLNGKIGSTIDDKKLGKLRIWGFRFTRFYKKFLHKIR